MRTIRHRLPMATAMLMCASSALIPGLAYASTGHDAAGYSSPAPTPPVDTSSAESSPQSGVTTSHYMILVGPGQDPDQIGYRTGCTDGKSGTSGLRVLFFGTQEAGDKLRPPGTSITNKVPRVDHAAVERASLGWIRGFTQCGTATAVVAVATNNKADGGVGGADAGTAWAKLVERIASSTTSGRVTVGGGLDAEPKWSAPDWARGWVDGFVRSSSRALYVAGSADGCLFGHAEQCANRWTTQDVYYVATGAGTKVYATPQIYRTDGLQARQWAGISQLEQKAGRSPVRFASVMTQQKACEQRPPCTKIDNSPSSARDQLSKALSDPDNLDGSKNIKGTPAPSDPKAGKDSDDAGAASDSGATTGPRAAPDTGAPTGPGAAADSGATTGPVAATGPETGVGPGAPAKAGGSPTAGAATDASNKAGSATFASTDVAWPDDQSQLTWLTAQPILPGEPVG